MRFPQWRRKRRRVDSGALDRALALPVPEMSRDIPFDAGVPLTPATTFVFTHVAAVAVLYGLSVVFVGAYAPGAIEIAIAATALAVVVTSSLVQGALNPDRRLHVSEQGIRLNRLFGSRAIAWWEVTGVRARHDLSDLRIDTASRGLTIQMSGMKEEARANTLLALRARLDGTTPITPWEPSRMSREPMARLAGATGSLVLLLTLSLGPRLHASGVLGIRCSGPSSYLDTRFGLRPGQQGCVAIRVSGAAARAGIRQGDRLIAMNGAPITSGNQFNDRFYDEGNHALDFSIVRGGDANPIKVHVRLGSSSSPNSPDNDPLTWFLRARGNPDVQQSIQQYSRAIELAPDFDLAYAFRGELETDTDPAGALADFQQALTLNPQSARAYFAMANYYANQIFADPAVPKTYMQRAIELDDCVGGFLDTNVDCERDYSALADLLRFRADNPGSMDAAMQALAYYPKASWPLYELALSYEIAKDKPMAKKYARQFLASSAADKWKGGTTAMNRLLLRLQKDTP